MRRRKYVGRMFVDVQVVRSLEGPWESATVQVDGGADDSILPRPLLKKLGVRRVSRERFELADGRSIVRDVGIVLLKLKGEVGATRVLFGAPKDGPVLGNVALEELSLEVDSESGYLKKARKFLISSRRVAWAQGF